MKKFVVAAFAGLIATASLASTAEAGHRHHHHGWGPSFGLVIDTRPTYVEPSYVVVEETCYIKKVKRYDAYGNRYYKRIRVCD